jgi:hypothetical protein
LISPIFRERRQQKSLCIAHKELTSRRIGTLPPILASNRSMSEPTLKIPADHDALESSTVGRDTFLHAADRTAPVARSSDAYVNELITHGWPSITRGIVLAGGAYPAAVAAMYLVVGIVVVVVELFNSSLPKDRTMVIAVVFGGVVFATIYGLIGIVWTVIVSVATLPVVHAVVWSMKLRPSLIWLGAFSGGLVAFVAIIPGAMKLPSLFDTGEAWLIAIVLLMGPALATIVGQIGGALGGKRASERIAIGRLAPKIELLRLRFAMNSHSANELLVAGATTDGEQASSRFQFSMIHLLWAGVWLSLLLTVIRLSGIPYVLILPLLVGWGAFQALTLFVGKLVVRRFGPWSSGR